MIYCLENLIRYIIITMVTEFNSVHKHSESPPQCGGRKGETIVIYLLGSHDPSNSGHRITKREPKKWTKLLLYKYVEMCG